MNEFKYFSLQNLSIGYNKKFPILEEVNLSLGAGEIIAVIGSNGSGKTTLIKTITRLIRELKGELNIHTSTKMSLVPQIKELKLGFPLTVEAALQLTSNIKIFGASDTDNEKFANEILVRMGIDTYKDILIKECSGGQLQKYLLARSLISDANCIFLDEPLDALDQNSQKEIISLLSELTIRKNLSFFIITHHITEEWLNHFSTVYNIQGRFLQ